MEGSISRFYCPAGLILSLVLLAFPAHARPPVWVIANPEHAAHEQFIHGLRDSLARAAVPIPPLRIIRPSELAGTRPQAQPILCVTVGSRAAEFFRDAGLEPVRELHTLIPEATYKKLYPQPETHAQGGTHSAIYLDQPIFRLLRLARRILPEKPRIGVLLGRWSGIHEDQLRMASEVAQLRTLKDAKELIPALEALLPASNLLLALPDPTVYNRATVHAILLNSYRYRTPVLGFSQSYAHAGALLSLYSTPRQIGRQTGELIEAMVTSGKWRLPSPAYPRYFSITVNRQVAYSLGLSLPAEDELTSLLDGEEGPR